MMESKSKEIRYYRSIWISDIHLGTRGCKAEFLLDFLKHNESEKLYLVGDIIDGWRLKTSWHYWDRDHTGVIQKVLKKSRKGTQVFLIPGNHDETLRDFIGMRFGGVKILAEAVHVTADGRRFLITHGDQFDGVIQHARWVAKLGSWAYDFAIGINHWFNWVRVRMGLPYWSLSAYLKHKVKDAVKFIAHFEEVMVQEAQQRNMDGVVCGHIHKAEIRDFNGILYCNDGDWVESCTALVEHMDGRLEIIEWTQTPAVQKKEAAIV